MAQVPRPVPGSRITTPDGGGSAAGSVGNSADIDSSARREAAQRTRRRVLSAAHTLFTTQGYADTSVAQVARRARVSVDTVYASVGRKPQLLLAVHDMTLASGPEPVPADERGYVQAIRSAASAREKIELYAAALATVLPVTTPLLNALREAGSADRECRALATSISDRRAANMLLFAADLRSTGELREDLSDQHVADLVWSMNSAEYYTLLASRGTSADAFARLLADTWTRTLLHE